MELLRHATQGIRAHFAGYEEHDNLMWMRRLASLYLPDPLIVQTLEVMQVPIDLSDIPMIRDALAEGRAEGRASGHAEGRAEGEDRARRDDIGRVVRTRFADEELASRAASIQQNLLEDTLYRAVTAATSEELAAWLQTHSA